MPIMFPVCSCYKQGDKRGQWLDQPLDEVGYWFSLPLTRTHANERTLTTDGRRLAMHPPALQHVGRRAVDQVTHSIRLLI